MASEWTRHDVGPRIYVFHKVMIILLSLTGILSQALAFRAYSKHYRKINSVVRAFGGFLFADTLLILIHLPQAIWALATRHIGDTLWCQLLAWATVTQVASLQGTTVLVAFATWRLVQHKPLGEKEIALWTTFNYAVGLVVAVCFLAKGSLGPYKSMYCNVRTDAYREGVAATVLTFVFGAIFFAAVFYLLAYRRMRRLEANIQDMLADVEHRGSTIVLKRGALLVGLMYVWFGLHIVIGLLKVSGHVKEVPGALDVFASCIVKLMPIFDGWYMFHMVRKVAEREGDPPPDTFRELLLDLVAPCLAFARSSRTRILAGDGRGSHSKNEGKPPSNNNNNNHNHNAGAKQVV